MKAIKDPPKKAIVKRVVDGDTLILDISIEVQVVLPITFSSTSDILGDLRSTPPLSTASEVTDTNLGMALYADPSGMLVMRKVRARLYKFHAAEMGTPEGVIARDRLVAALPIGTEITIELHGKDKYGRWLVVPMLDNVNVCLSLVDNVLAPELLPEPLSTKYLDLYSQGTAAL